MGRYKTFVIREFAGLNEDQNPDSLADNELSVAINVWKDGRSVGTRPGLVRGDADYDAQIASAKAIHGLYELRTGFDANRKLVAICGGVVHSADATTVGNGAGVTITDPGAGTTNAGKHLWTFATHKNTLYAAGGNDGDTPISWDGSAGTVSEVVFQNSSAADIDAKFIFEKWNYLFLNGMNGTAVEDNPTVGRYSKLNDGSSWPIGNSFGGTSAIGGISSYGDEYTTGWGDYTDNRGDFLLMLTNRQIYPVIYTGDAGTPFIVSSAVANGCVSQRAFVSLGIDSGDAVYLSNSGFHSMRQSQQFGATSEKFLSWKIRPTFATINFSRIRQSCGAYWPEEGVVLFAVPTGSNTYNDTILCLDLKEQSELTADTSRWFIWKLNGFDANVVTVARDPSSKRSFLYIGDSNGNVLRFSKGTFSDVGEGYTPRFVTKHNDFNIPGTTKGIGDCWVGLQPGGDYVPKLRFIFDYGRRVSQTRDLTMPVSNAIWGSSVWGSFLWASENETFRKKVFGSGVGDTIALEFSHVGTNEPFRVTTVAQQIRPMGETQGIGE